MKTKLLALLFLVGSAAFAAPRVVVGVGVGRPGLWLCSAGASGSLRCARSGATAWVTGARATMDPAGLRHAITDLATTVAAAIGVGNYRSCLKIVRIDRSLWSRLRN